jgi:thiamine-phosphate pyrophosphorylase
MFNRIQYISQGNTPEEHKQNIIDALKGGCRWIQLRLKNSNHEIILNTAFEIKKYCENYEATFIINDFPYIAAYVDADGVHLGLSDMNVMQARKIVGNNKIIGATANTIENIYQHIKDGADYIGLGPLRYTKTKENLSNIIGIDGYAKIMNTLKKNNINIPIYAIGGVSEYDFQNLLKIGIYGIAASNMITNAINKSELFKKLNLILNENVNNCR